ncbi:MAG: ParB/RepB/Spo0J family partition protein [Woeseia sp.]
MSTEKRLGRGLDALLGTHRQRVTQFDQEAAGKATTLEIAVTELRPGRYQPRRIVSDESLIELADSIREQGVLQPLVVRAVAQTAEGSNPKGYEIVAGERRWRAAQIAGLSTVPVVVRELDDQSALAVALIENLQREDLNPIDQAQSLSRLADEFALTHEQVAKAVGRSRSSVSNLLRLLELQSDVKDLLADGGIDMGHARALLPLDPERQVAMARKALARKMSVRQVEQAVRLLLAAPVAATDKKPVDMQARWLQQQIAKELGRKITIRPGNDGHYRLQIEFDDLAELQTALRRIEELIGQVRNTAGPRMRDTEA